MGQFHEGLETQGKNFRFYSTGKGRHSTGMMKEMIIKLAFERSF
jgi:hypothetical protein